MLACVRTLVGHALPAAALAVYLAAAAAAQGSAVSAGSAAQKPLKQAPPARAAAPRASFESGVSFYEQQRYLEALGVFIRVLAEDPRDQRALDYEGRSIDALFEQREDAAMLEGTEIIHDAMTLLERRQIAARLVLEGRKDLEMDDPIEAEDLFLKALDIVRQDPDALAGLTQTDELARWELREGNLDRPSSELYALRFALQGLMKFNAGAFSEAVPVLQQSFFLLDPSAPEYPVVEELILRAKANAGQTTAKPRAAAAASDEEAAEASAQRPATVSRKAALPSVTAPAEQPSALHAAVRDPRRSGELYLQAVTSYLTGKRDQALSELKEALVLDPSNTRAKKLQDRIRLEDASQSTASGEQTP